PVTSELAANGRNTVEYSLGRLAAGAAGTACFASTKRSFAGNCAGGGAAAGGSSSAVVLATVCTPPRLAPDPSSRADVAGGGVSRLPALSVARARNRYV